jgi:aryl-alcohol dehydrogenase-like predicted oxidoreductase/RimJ/RimL family protein N-acetyltransferase
MVKDNMNIENIKTNRFVLKKFSLNYISKKYLNWFKDQDVNRFISFKPKNVSDLRKNIIETLKEKNTIFFAIFIKKKHIGNLKIHNINYKKNEAWLGILIGDKNFRGQKVSPEVIENLKTHLIKKKIYFLKLNVHKKNLPAIKTYIKSKFFIVKKNNNFYTMKCNLYSKKIILGLAQLQSIYGVTNNEKKKLSKKESSLILKKLDQSNIEEVDSAFSYPFQTKLFKETKNKILFNTKVLTTEEKNFNFYTDHLKKIKKYKNIEVNTLFIHDGNNLLTKDGKKLFNKILELKKKKIIKKIGVSFHDFTNFKKILDMFKIDVVQIPYNVADQRGKKYFSFIKKKHIEIQVRSIFLQGALLKKIKSNFKLCEIYNKIKLKDNSDRVNFLISFVLDEINIDKIIIGVRQESELEMILNFSKLNFNKKIYRNLKTNDLDIIDPLKWKELNYHEKK